MFDFIRNCQTFPNVLYYFTFPLAVGDVLILPHPQ